MHQEIICMFGGITGGLDGVQFPDTPLIETNGCLIAEMIQSFFIQKHCEDKYQLMRYLMVYQ